MESWKEMATAPHVDAALKDKAKIWFRSMVALGIFEGIEYMEINLKAAWDAIPQGYAQMFEGDTRNLQQIKNDLFNRKTHQAVSEHADHFQAAVAKALSDAAKKWRADDVLGSTQLKKLKGFAETTSAVRTYCALEKVQSLVHSVPIEGEQVPVQFAWPKVPASTGQI